MVGFWTVIKVAGVIVQKVVDLHNAGADNKVAAEIHDLIKKCHAVVDRHHQKHCRKEET